MLDETQELKAEMLVLRAGASVRAGEHDGEGNDGGSPRDMHRGLEPLGEMLKNL